MHSFTLLSSALILASAAQAHIALTYPAPFRASYNPHATNIDYSITSPLAADGSNFPCKGYLSDLGTAAGAPTASFVSGQAYNFTTGSGALHGGGSCQAALSYDKGVTFQVIHSYIGSCPIEAGQSFDFTIPADAPASGSDPAIFAWTWFNEIGNREMYMDCAAVTITGGSASKTRDTPTVAFSARPGLFVANLGNGCTTAESVDAVFPDPGPDVTTKTTKSTENTISGTCAAVNGIGGGSGSGGSTPSAPAESSISSATSSVEAPTSAVQTPTSSAPSSESSIFTVPTVTSTQDQATPTSLPGGVFVTVPTSNATAPATSIATTLSTVYLNSTTIASTPTATSSSPSATGSAGTGTAIKSGTACTSEGEWNCVGGTSFQQCASGSWSIVQPLAAGTSCTGSLSSTLDIVKRSRYFRPQPVRKHL